MVKVSEIDRIVERYMNEIDPNSINIFFHITINQSPFSCLVSYVLFNVLLYLLGMEPKVNFMRNSLDKHNEWLPNIDDCWNHSTKERQQRWRESLGPTTNKAIFPSVDEYFFWQTNIFFKIFKILKGISLSKGEHFIRIYVSIINNSLTYCSMPLRNTFGH